MCPCLSTGVGALYVRRRPRVRLEPIQSGGGQERGLRSGTVPTPLAVGLGAACEVARQEMQVMHVRNLAVCEEHVEQSRHAIEWHENLSSASCY